MKARYLIASALCLVSAAAEAQIGNLCSELAQIQKAQPQFANFRGAPMSGEKWQSRMTSIGGIGNCTVDATDSGATTLRCETPRFDTEEAARARSSPLIAGIPKCLGPSWPMTRMDLGKSLENYGFYSAGSNVNFSVAVVRMDLDRTTWTVWMTAQMNEQSGSSVPAKAETSTVVQPMDPWPQDTKTFCEDLQKVIGAAKDGSFESIKGRPVSNRSWKSQVVLDATSRCDISAMGNLVSYSCQAGRQTDSAVMTARRDSVVASVRACVDRSWQASKRVSSSGVEIAEFESSLLPVSIQVRLRKSDGEYRLSIDVDRE